MVIIILYPFDAAQARSGFFTKVPSCNSSFLAFLSKKQTTSLLTNFKNLHTFLPNAPFPHKTYFSLLEIYSSKSSSLSLENFS